MSRSSLTISSVMLFPLLLAVLSTPNGAGAVQPRRLLAGLGVNTIASVAAGVDDLSTLVAAVQASTRVLGAATDNQTAVTVFAPTNEAFATALSQLGMTAAELLADTQTLNNILEYHIVPTVLMSNDATSSWVAVDTMLPGAKLNILMANGMVYVNGATVITADVSAGMSVVHIIDKVLLPPPVPTIASTAEINTALLSTLLAAVKASPTIAAAAMDPHTAVTVFAPTNEAFAAALTAMDMTAEELLADEAMLTRILSYHIVPMLVPSTAATMEVQNLGTLLPSATVAVMMNDSGVMVNDAKVIVADVPAGQSIIHLIDTVLMPPSMPSTTMPTIAEVAAENSDILSTLLAAVMASPTILAAATNASTMVTVFAPTNEAFAAALSALDMTAEELLSDVPMLTRILSYHIVPMVVPSSAATRRVQNLNTLLPGATVAVKLDRSYVMVNEAKVVAADISAGMSVVHVIDMVLMPPPMPTIADVATENSDMLSTLLAAVKASPSILAAATNASTMVTVFAPTNEAFAAALSALDMTAEELLSDEPMLTRILSYHIVPMVVPSSAAMNTVQNLDTLLPGATVAVMMQGSAVMVNDAMVVAADIPAGRSVVHVINMVLMPPMDESMKRKNLKRTLLSNLD